MIVDAFNQRSAINNEVLNIAICGDKIMFPKQFPPVMITELAKWSQLQNPLQSMASLYWK